MANSFSLTLQQLTAIKCAVLVWNEHNVICEVKLVTDDEWDSLEAKVIQNVRKLPDDKVAELIKRKILGFVKPIGEEVFAYREYNSHILGVEFSRSSLNYFRWTPLGTVDLKKSAEALMGDETIDVVSRFNLACLYCLEHEVSLLRNRVPEIHIRNFRGNVPSLLIQYHITEWKKEADEHIDPSRIQRMDNACAFSMTAGLPNTIATEYFFNKMTSEEKDKRLFENAVVSTHAYGMFRDEHVTKHMFFELLFFLLRVLNNEQRTKLYRNFSHIILKGFCDWPMQDLFLSYSNEMMPFLDEEACHDMLHTLVYKLQHGYRDYDYVTLICAFWEQITDDSKQCVLKDFFNETGLLSKLLEVSALKIILVLLRHANNKVKTRVFSKGLVAALIVNEGSDTALLKPMIRSIYPRDVCENFRDNFSDQQFDWLVRQVYNDLRITNRVG